jgi:hypothetical protein
MPVLPIPAFLLPVAWSAGEVPVSFGSCPWPARERTAVFKRQAGLGLMFCLAMARQNIWLDWIKASQGGGSRTALPCRSIICSKAFDRPFDHPDDPTGSVWIRLDRRPTRREQARSVWSRPDRRSTRLRIWRLGVRTPRGALIVIVRAGNPLSPERFPTEQLEHRPAVTTVTIRPGSGGVRLLCLGRLRNHRWRPADLLWRPR